MSFKFLVSFSFVSKKTHSKMVYFFKQFKSGFVPTYFISNIRRNKRKIKWGFREHLYLHYLTIYIQFHKISKTQAYVMLFCYSFKENSTPYSSHVLSVYSLIPKALYKLLFRDFWTQFHIIDKQPLIV